MNAITSLIPTPRAVRIARADPVITVYVSEFTLRDLADLQAILDGQWVDPLTEIQEALQAAQGDAQRELLKSAYEKAEKYGPVYGEPSGRAYYASPEGVAALLWVALRRNHDTLTPAGCADLAAIVSPAEYSQIWRIAHGSPTLKSLEKMLGLGSATHAGREVTWGQLIDEVTQSHPGWTYEYIYGLTITEFTNARRAGKPVEAGVPIPMDGDMLRKIAEQREKFYGPNAGAIKGGE